MSVSFYDLSFRVAQRLLAGKRGPLYAFWFTCALLFLASWGVTYFGMRIYRLGAAPSTIQGIIVRVDYFPQGSDGSYRDNFILNLADGRRVRWACAERSCGHAVDTLFALQDETPAPAEIELAAGRVVGLNVRGVEVVSRTLHMGREMRDGLSLFAISAVAWFLAGGGLLYGLADRRRERAQVDARVRRALAGDSR